MSPSASITPIEFVYASTIPSASSTAFALAIMVL
jgi:hypothetical protein